MAISIYLLSISGVGNPYHGADILLPTLSGVILGGVSIMSVGSGSIWGTVIGLLIVNTLFNGLTTLNMGTFYIKVFQGVALILIVMAYEFRNRNKKKYIG